MRTDFDLKLIDDKVLDVYIEPAENRDLLDPTFDNSTLDLSWMAHSYED